MQAFVCCSSVPARFSKGQGANPEKGHLRRDMIIWKGHILIKDVNQTFVFIHWITVYARTTSVAHIELYLSTFKAEKLVKQLVTQVFLSLLGTVELYMQYVLKGDLFHTVSMVYHILPVSPFYPCCAWWHKTAVLSKFTILGYKATVKNSIKNKEYRKRWPRHPTNTATKTLFNFSHNSK